MLTRQSLLSGLPELHTERLKLRPLVVEDYQTLRSLLSLPEVIKYMNRNRRPPVERAGRLFREIQSGSATLDSIHYVIVPDDTERLSGLVSFQHWHERKGEAQVGYLLDPTYWGRGLAAEAVGGLLSFGMDSLDLKRIEGRCHEQNTASAKVLMKNGFRYLRRIGMPGLKDDQDGVLVYELTSEIYFAMDVINNKNN
ncbi:GNAT family N-acetyltransferase [Paenibacillus sp. P96]|uniref:GNAT family N-acetyltransferase n=1 Tax=Paenibacillus zeirhizosphaerae TaxID=2987519 RepID=A0ABT9FUR8_9BACL|nr:GNAT family N-acetyltransferase [Paenibacillus sp. P96]MDP4098461.1 GNAT family N-acetyltransferase [Paenibacillus sp. P96]